MKQILIILVVMPVLSHSQKIFDKWEIGINVGTYKANKHTAIRYDGADVEYDYNLDVEYYHDLAPNSSYSVYERIKQSYGDLDWDVTPGSYPLDMRYNFGLDVGLHIGYKTSDMNLIFVDVNFSRLTLNDALTLEVNDPSTQTTQPDIRVEALTGKENRLVINPGLQFGLGEEPDQHMYMQLGPNLTFARVEKNSMVVQGKEYILTRYNKNGNSIYDVADYGGMGWGGFLGFGYRYRLSDKFVGDVGSTAMYTRINIGPDYVGNQKIQKFKLQYAFYIRILWS